MTKKQGFTLIELLVVVAIIALLISILLPSLSRAREMAKRTACSANVKAIGAAIYIYQEENQGVFPTAPDVINSTGSNNPTVSYVGFMGGHATLPRDRQSRRVAPGGPNAGSELSTTRSLWLLVRSGAVVPKNFICPSSDEVPDPTADVTRYYDFIGYGSVSYGYQIPYDDVNTCKPTVDVDPRMALMADKSPWSARGGEEADPGDEPFGGTTWFKDTVNPFGEALYSNGNDGLADANCAGVLGECDEETPPEKWKRFNSPNHGGQNQGAGQSVLYPDGHAAWNSKPLAGVDSDNIYTKMDSATTEEDWWKNAQWGILPDVDNPIYPGKESFGADGDAFTDTLLWP